MFLSCEKLGNDIRTNCWKFRKERVVSGKLEQILRITMKSEENSGNYWWLVFPGKLTLFWEHQLFWEIPVNDIEILWKVKPNQWAHFEETKLDWLSLSKTALTLWNSPFSFFNFDNSCKKMNDWVWQIARQEVEAILSKKNMRNHYYMREEEKKTFQHVEEYYVFQNVCFEQKLKKSKRYLQSGKLHIENKAL